MLATRGDHVPTGPDWVHEVKWDGIRALVDVTSDESGGVVRVWTRSGREIGVAFPELRELSSVADDLLLDGEIVALGDGGVPTLSGLADRIHVTDARKARLLAVANPVTLLAFDVLRHDGRDLAGRPWKERREVLEAVGLDDVSWQVPATYDDGPALLAAAEQQGLEGIVSKRLSARYAWGTRSRDWLKFPIRPTGSFVVGGYRYETDSDTRLGAVLVGEPTADGLASRGRVGSGIAGRSARVLTELLVPLGRAENPFLDVPRLDAKGTVWVEPVLVVDVQFLRVTTDGRLRQPSYRGVRADLAPGDL
jgi:bifunctional non-homologous end joining protein LigD